MIIMIIIVIVTIIIIISSFGNSSFIYIFYINSVSGQQRVWFPCCSILVIRCPQVAKGQFPDY